MTDMKKTKIASNRFGRIFGLFFICILIISCSGGVSRSRTEREIRNQNGFITLKGKDDNREYECSGFDPSFDSENTNIYDCNNGELVINR